MTPAELVDDELKREQVAITSLQNGTLSYFDSERRLQQERVQAFVQLDAIGGRSASLSPGEAVVELTDGQRFVGEWRGGASGGASGGESLRWEHPTLGTMTLPLDRLRAVRFRTLDGWDAEPIAHGPTPAQDTVTLVNGDELRGFVLEMTDDAVVLQPDGGDEPWSLPHARIAMLRLANPDEPPATGHQVMVLGDGSRAHVTGLAISREQVQFASGLRDDGERGEMGLDDLVGVDFTAHGRRLVPLVDQPMTVIEGGEVFGLPTPPRTVGKRLRLQAPIVVQFELPESAQRFAAVAELALDGDAPAHLPDWADFEVIVQQGDHEQRYRLHGSQREVSINLALDDATLRLELDPGVNGPILDRLQLRDAVLLIHEPTDPSPASDAGL
ncbi:hypothetical protein ACERK3_00985 [Phycisphaerales bacterium AB-hyl4]|uniref:DUF4340 domain-containing protein n=1 Tax=Natronomicrosphaera hydrolytica TaxID=3242702 RepID=A0ABV4U006_9BACT